MNRIQVTTLYFLPRVARKPEQPVLKETPAFYLNFMRFVLLSASCPVAFIRFFRYRLIFLLTVPLLNIIFLFLSNEIVSIFILSKYHFSSFELKVSIFLA